MTGVTPIADYADQLDVVASHLDALAAAGGDVPDWTNSYDRLGAIIEALGQWRACLAFMGDHRAAILTRVAPNLRILAVQLRTSLVYEPGQMPESVEGPVT